MNTSKHTPGPWIIENNDILGHISAIVHVATIHNDIDGNARLIASAPELLEACKDAYELMSAGKVLTACERKLCKAIAKAEGKTL